MNNYIYEYYQGIRDGSIVAGQWITKWYEQIIHGLEEGRYEYKPKKAARAINFIEMFAKHREGPLGGQSLKLELWQKAMLSVVFGIYDHNGLRQFREVMLEVGRKNGKTLMLAAIAEYMLYFDGEIGARLYFVAPKLKQSHLCFDAFAGMITKEPELHNMSEVWRELVKVPSTDATAEPLAFASGTSDGFNPSCVVADEPGSWPAEAGLKQYEVLKSAFGARTQPILFVIGTAGYVNDGIFDELTKRATAVINGTSDEARFAPFLYTIDDPDKWNDINELQKSMPNLGVSVSVDYMLEEIAVAENSFSKKVEFLVKYCNIKQASAASWLSAQDIKKSFPPCNYTLEDFRDSYALAGVDLSISTDLTAAVVLIERDSKLYYFTRFFLPRNKLDECIARDQIPYRAYVERGFLILSGENQIDYNDVYNWFVSLVEDYEIYPLQVGYDRYNALYWTQQMQGYGFHMDDVVQGPNLTGVIIDTEAAMKDGRLICAEDNDLMKLHWMSAALKIEDQTNRRKLVKIHSNGHIDGVAALLDAMCMRHVHYDELGEQLANRGD